MSETDTAQSVQDTGLSSADDTSKFEDAEDIENSMSDIEVDLSELDNDTEAEAATEANETESDEPNVEVDEGEPSDEKDSESSDEESEQKRVNNDFARRRIEERERREALKQQQQQEFLQEAEDARDLALRQLQVDAYNNRVLTNNSLLESQLDRAIADIPEFRNGTPEVREELASSLDDFERMYVTRDRNGDPIEVRGNLNEFLQAKAESIRRLTGVGARAQVSDKAKAKSRTDTVPTKKPATPKSDPMLEGFDEKANE